MIALLAVAALAEAAPTRQQSMLQAKDLADARDTPVTRVVKLLEEMSRNLHKDMDEDEGLYNKLACWCNNNEYDKDEALAANEAKIADLKATIESLTARSAELKTRIKELETEVAADKAALAEATALREKQLKEFHGAELDNVQALENMKAALEVLAKHQGKKGWQDASTRPTAATAWGGAFLQGKETQIVQRALNSAAAFTRARKVGRMLPPGRRPRRRGA